MDTNYRRKGIGKILIEEVESWAEKQGAIAITLNSGNRSERAEAHQFYSSMGYTSKSIGFGKKLL
ncbi:GNAT family N-acetyltransferase [Pontibacillus marinus]|uniref:GNAT family N-acetyltransferase n=1 Tax=Pontibacillus marinus TaxID=273164 RepID=UPI0022773701|nr:GNAT family N-acetyltransferase [Pontibacillus marinus]